MRSVSVLLIKYIYKENRVKVKFLYNNFYTQQTCANPDENEKTNQVNYSSSSTLNDSLKSIKRKSRKSLLNISQKHSNEINELIPPLVLPEQDEKVYKEVTTAFRELPVDCPLMEEAFSIEKARREADLVEQHDNIKRMLSSNSIDKDEFNEEILLKGRHFLILHKM